MAYVMPLLAAIIFSQEGGGPLAYPAEIIAIGITELLSGWLLLAVEFDTALDFRATA